MEIQYDIRILKIVSGDVGERKYVVLQRLKPLTKDGIAERIQDSRSLTKGNLKAVLLPRRKQLPLFHGDFMRLGYFSYKL